MRLPASSGNYSDTKWAKTIVSVSQYEYYCKKYYCDEWWKDMATVERITASIEKDLLERFEGYVSQKGFPSRSEAIKSLMRSALVEQEWQKGKSVAGAISLIFDHHKSGVLQKLTETQHDFENLIVCSQHVHLDHDNCMEVVMVRGRVSEIRKLLESINSIKGIKHSSLMVGTIGKDVP
jgi:CopG family nickel-responsive transcriptional regulator